MRFLNTKSVGERRLHLGATKSRMAAHYRSHQNWEPTVKTSPNVITNRTTSYAAVTQNDQFPKKRPRSNIRGQRRPPIKRLRIRHQQPSTTRKHSLCIKNIERWIIFIPRIESYCQWTHEHAWKHQHQHQQHTTNTNKTTHYATKTCNTFKRLADYSTCTHRRNPW